MNLTDSTECDHFCKFLSQIYHSGLRKRCVLYCNRFREPDDNILHVRRDEAGVRGKIAGPRAGSPAISGLRRLLGSADGEKAHAKRGLFKGSHGALIERLNQFGQVGKEDCELRIGPSSIRPPEENDGRFLLAVDGQQDSEISIGRDHDAIFTPCPLTGTSRWFRALFISPCTPIRPQNSSEQRHGCRHELPGSVRASYDRATRVHTR